jgi:hypothetical protein
MESEVLQAVAFHKSRKAFPALDFLKRVLKFRNRLSAFFFHVVVNPEAWFPLRLHIVRRKVTAFD